MMNLCVISRTTVLGFFWGGQLFPEHPPPTPPSSLSHLHGLSTSMQIWNVNDHPEGQTKKVNHFHAMLNM